MSLSQERKRQLWDALGFLLLCAWFTALNGWTPFAALLSAACIHEAGHWAALRLWGVSTSAVRLSPFGAEMEIQSGGLSYPQELAAVLAGPGANVVAGLCLAAAGERKLFAAAAGANWVLALFNLLPTEPLDGGRALRLLACWLLGPDRGERLSAAVGAAAGGIGAGGLLWVMAASGGNLWLLPAAALLADSALREAAMVSGRWEKRKKAGTFCK
jgi:stage IV sporulation protein FB